MTARPWLFLPVLLWVGIGWGSTQPLGKIATSGGQGPFGLIFWQQVVCVAVLGLVALVRRKGQFYWPAPFGRDDAALAVSSALHALLYATYVWLAASAGSVFASQSSYLTTAAGMVWAMVLLDERFPPLVWLALAAMLAGVALVQPRRRVPAAAGGAGEACSA